MAEAADILESAASFLKLGAKTRRSYMREKRTVSREEIIERIVEVARAVGRWAEKVIEKGGGSL